jgi:hypothetical protein
MKPKGKLVRSIFNPSAGNTVWCGSVTDDEPARCESCNAQARHSEYELDQPSAFDTTKEATSEIAGAAPIIVSSDLAGRLASVLDEEADPSLAVSTLSIVSAVACRMAAENTSESLKQVVERFVRGFELALPAEAATKRNGASWH